MRFNLKTIITAAAVVAVQSAAAAVVTVDMTRHGVRPGASDLSRRIERVLSSLTTHPDSDEVVLSFAPGRYDFYPDKAIKRELFISNHDQTNPRTVGLMLDSLHNVTIDGAGSDFVFHGRMLPIAAVGCTGLTLTDFTIDFENPQIAQVRITDSGSRGITFTPEPWVKWRLASDGSFETYGEGWTMRPASGIAFEAETRHIVYNTSDLPVNLSGIIKAPNGQLLAPKWVDSRLKPGMAVALRGWERPAPGIFLDECISSTLSNVKVHYAEGMGLIAQMCNDITLDEFDVCLRDESPRFFTTQADATHFSGCSGLIESRGGYYEGMMDDAINVHGTYLKITASENSRTLVGRYMHPQSYGFRWGAPGDSVQLVLSAVMQRLGEPNVIEAIEPVDAPTAHGAKEFRITLSNPVDLPVGEPVGIENLTASPEVVFADNVIANNRARGALFSTPRRVECLNNVFDHVSGTAVLLCGDCNGWYETGACRDVLIRGNRFINNLTSLFQFTEAVISIYPEIPDLASQTECFHGGEGYPGVVIEGNDFVTFDAPLVFARSIDGLRIAGNTITVSEEYKPFHHNRFRFNFQKARRVTLDDNRVNQPTSISFD